MYRITNTMLSSNYLKNVNKNMNYLQTLQNQLSTGKEISKPSDDPYKASRIVKMYADVSANEQYNDNITDVTNFLDVTDTSITQMSNLYSRVRELLVSAGNAAYGSEQLQSIQDEMKVKVDQLAQLLNTSFDGKYVFGGTKVDSKPVTVVDGKIQYADADGKGLPTVYKDSDGNYTTSKDNEVKLTDPGSTDGKTVRDDLEDELAGLGTSDEDIARKDEINAMLDESKKIYKSDDSKYTSEQGEENEVTNISDIKKEDIELQIKELESKESLSDEESKKLEELKQIKNGIVAYNQISADMKIEISQGVTVNYNKTACEILEFTDTDDPSRTINVSDLFNDIINNLNSEDGKEALTGENLSDLDKAISKLLTKSSEVGAMQNRMESAKTQNESDNDNLTAILSSVEDIDFTEKMIDFSTLMTVYKASLQISSNILPTTIMDYL